MEASQRALCQCWANPTEADMTLVITSDTELSSDQLPATGIAVQFGAPSVTLTITLTILADIAVVSQDSIAIYSNELGSVLNNHGDLLTGASFFSAVYFVGNFAKITNEAVGTITGITNAVAMGSNGGDFTNHGTVRAIAGDGVSLFASTDSTLFNDGDIYGRESGVYTQSGSSVIENEGSITSHAWGILVGAGTATILNKGTIAGSMAAGAILVAGGALNLTNSGTLDGEVDCSTASGNDTIVNSGLIKGVVHLGGGSDSFNGSGGKSGDIFGDTGNDTLTGGKGGDWLFGGADSDVFKFVNVKETGKGQARDVIADFSDVQGDQIDLDAIDAKKGPGNQDFKFIGAQKFHHKAGELHVLNKGAFLLVEGDINGDGKADFQIEVTATRRWRRSISSACFEPWFSRHVRPTRIETEATRSMDPWSHS